ncbi:MAG: DnaA/Hda family protein [Pseudomonadota bacterium]|nr:DnaA/Hda family protein [Pseudomonadota bacterium]
MTFSRDDQQLLAFDHGIMTEFDNFIALKAHQPIVNHLKNLNVGEHVYIFGEKSSGRSHLAKAMCVYHTNRRSLYLPLSELKFLDKRMLEGINQVDLICVEDIDLLVDNPVQQVILFDLINLCKAYNVSMLITARFKPANMDNWLPDLKTRLQAMCCWQLPQMMDDEKAIILEFWLKKQNMFLEPEIIHYVFKNITRDLKESKDLLESFARHCMKIKKTPNIKAIKEYSG